MESICFENIATVESRARAPTFYSGPVTDEMRSLAGMAATLVAAVFGALHCMAWSSHFPSPLSPATVASLFHHHHLHPDFLSTGVTARHPVS
jgi:hypothetical protein